MTRNSTNANMPGSRKEFVHSICRTCDDSRCLALNPLGNFCHVSRIWKSLNSPRFLAGDRYSATFWMHFHIFPLVCTRSSCQADPVSPFHTSPSFSKPWVDVPICETSPYHNHNNMDPWLLILSCLPLQSYPLVPHTGPISCPSSLFPVALEMTPQSPKPHTRRLQSGNGTGWRMLSVPSICMGCKNWSSGWQAEFSDSFPGSQGALHISSYARLWIAPNLGKQPVCS